MATIYDINFNNAAPSLLPPDKRFSKQVQWVRMLLSPLQYLRDLWFGSYRTGSVAPTWVNSAPYPKYAQVKYAVNNQVYESLINANNAIPTVATSWQVVQTNFIGLSERVLYNGQKVVLEYAMNKWFGTTFRQPNAQSDIYITNASVPIAFFRIGGLESNSSSVSAILSSEFVINAYTFTAVSNFTINCPIAVYNALDATLVNNNKIFRGFVDKYVPAGVTYTIATY